MTDHRRPRAVHVRSHNDVLQTLQALQRNRAKRNQRREFLIEGVRAINLALAHGWRINAFVHAASRPLSDWARGHLARADVPVHYVLAPELMDSLSQRDESSELMATVALPDDDPTRIGERAARRVRDGESLAPLIVLFDRPASPGNLGTLVRSCDALGVDGLLVTGHATDVYDPECVRASTGSLFALPVVRIHQQDVLERWLADLRTQWPGLRLVGTDEAGEARIDAHDFRGPTLLLVGNETWGLSAAWRAACDVRVRIPMGGAASSLNVACAASIALYEVARQRTPQPWSHAMPQDAPPTGGMEGA